MLSLLDATGTKMGVLNFPGTPSWKGPLPIPGAATLDAISVNVDATSETVTSEPPFSSDNQLEGIAATGLNPGELEVVDFPVDYVNQLADTRDGWKGHASCGPTSALMLMAYYHRLRPHSMQVNGTTYVVNGQVVNYPEKLPAHATNYGWYITEPYNFQSLAYDSLYDFSVYQPNATIAGQNTVGQSAAGAWASITQGSGITAINPLRDYLAMHDLGYKYQGSPSFDWIKSELDSGGIVLLGTWQTSAGHIIVARGYTTSNRVIVNDPYGSWLSAGNFNICGSSQEPSLACGADRVYTPSAINIAWALAVYPPRFSPMFYANESGVGTALQVENSTATIPGTNNWAGVYFPNYLGSRVQFTHYIAFAPFDSKSITSPSVGSLENGAMLLPWSGGFVAATNRRPVTSAPYSDGAAAAISSARASAVWYLPLVSSHKSTASGENNSTLQVMNVSGMDDTVRFQFFDTGGNLAVDTYQGIPARASLSWEIYGLGVPWNWIGSAQVSSVNGGQFVVGFETTTGNSGRHVSVGTPSERGSTNWGVPQFLSRLTNATGVPISTPLNIQNISGSTMAAGSIQFVCTKTSGSSTQTTINRSNPSPVANLTLFGVNPVTDGTIPAEWAGYCTVTAPGKVLVAIQQRYVGATYLGATGTYEGLPRGVNRNINQRRLLFPDVWRRVSKPNNQMLASSLIIQNVDTANVQVVIYYMASSTCGSSTSTNYSYGPFTLAPGESRNRNMRLYNSGSSEEATELPLGWCGSVIVGASGAVDGFVQQTDTNNPSGDWLSVYNAIILP